jgi:hypothetical protein
MGLRNKLGTSNVNELPEGNNFDGPLPKGEYRAEVTDAELKTTKSGDGEYIKVEWTITGPSHDGRKVWDNVNLVNPNEKAVEIGRARLRAMCEAAGMQQVPDLVRELVGIQANIGTKIKASMYNGERRENAEIRYVSKPNKAPEGVDQQAKEARRKARTQGNSGGGGGGQQSPPVSSYEQGFDSDDIPF